MGYEFLPFVLETSGGFSAIIIERIGSALASVYQVPPSSAIKLLYGKISFSLKRCIGEALSSAHNKRLVSTKYRVKVSDFLSKLVISFGPFILSNS